MLNSRHKIWLWMSVWLILEVILLVLWAMSYTITRPVFILDYFGLFCEIQLCSLTFNSELTVFNGPIDVTMWNYYEINVFYFLVSCFKRLTMNYHAFYILSYNVNAVFIFYLLILSIYILHSYVVGFKVPNNPHLAPNTTQTQTIHTLYQTQ